MNCINTNWLRDSGEMSWIITPSTYKGNGYYVPHEGGVYSYGGSNVIFPYSVKPVVVLKPNVKVIGGNGSSGNPYTLGLSE